MARRAKTQDTGNTLGGEDDIIFSPVCTWCTHWSPADGHHCKAYPAGGPAIPNEIWSGTNTHLTPVAGDHNIVFELTPDASPAAFKAENPGLAAAYAKREAGEEASDGKGRGESRR